MRAPAIPTLRPTSDRVREALFDIAEARDLVVGARVLDLFAGSGALGIEALSRGAAACTFVDSDRRAVDAIKANLEAVGMANHPGARLVTSDAIVYCSSHRGDRGGLGGVGDRVDLALVDPPYRYAGWAELLGALSARLALLEHGSPLPASERYETLREYRYGGTLVTLVQSTDKDNA